MLIEQIDVIGFKGINQLSFKLNSEFSVLIGENRWGRSSLISALSLLSFDSQFYQFIDSDFFHDEQGQQTDKITIRVVYCESDSHELDNQAYQPLLPVTYQSKQDNLRRITYLITAIKQNQRIITEHRLVNQCDEPLVSINHQSLITLLISLNPVLRLKNPLHSDNASMSNEPLSDYYIEKLSNQLKQHATQITKEQLNQGLKAATALLEYYFVDQQQRHHYKYIARKNSPQTQDWHSLEQINNTLDTLDNNYIRSVLLGILNSIIDAKGRYSLSQDAVPILILEEPESSLHPIILSVGFGLLKNLPTQKIITSNSSDLVSLFPLECIYRLIRKPDCIVANYIKPHALSLSDSRRILFHVLYRHSIALFARCWLLVEGETEVWLLKELAQQSGYHLSSEGILLIEFAQCGLRPLINYANKMGIGWHVVTDGDSAGKKYAEIAGSLCLDKGNEDNYLTVLPERDIENFLFRHGFSHIYKMAAFNTVEHIDMPISDIIQKAIHKRSKPDLAIAICDDVKKRGAQSVPTLLQKMFNKVIGIAKKI